MSYRCLHFLLGSSIRNFSNQTHLAAGFLSSIATYALRLPGSSTLVSIDGCKKPLKVLREYTADGVEEFAMAGLDHANSVLEERPDNSEPYLDILKFNVNEW
jgi:4-dimethylallyltryptophan N-methyltransferase